MTQARPLDFTAAFLQDRVEAFLDGLGASLPPEFRDLLAQSTQTSLGRAILADLFDAVPIVGDLANLLRVRHAGASDGGATVSRQALDLLAGSLPDPIGGILDLLTPTNTLTYLRAEGGLS